MSISLVQSNNGFTSSGTSATIVLNSTTVGSGDLIVVDMNWGSNTGSFSVSDDNSNSYTSHPDGPKTQGNQCHMFWAKNSSAVGSLTVTVTITGGGSHTIRCAAYDYNSTTGWPTTPLDAHNSNSATAAITDNTANMTPSGAGELCHKVIQFSTAVSNLACTTPYVHEPAGGSSSTGWHSDGRATGGDNTNCISGGQTCIFTWTTNSDFSSLIAAFIPSAAGAAAAFEDDSIPQLQPPQVEPTICVW